MTLLKNVALILIASALLTTLLVGFFAVLGIAIAAVIATMLLLAIASLFGVKQKLEDAILHAIDA